MIDTVRPSCDPHRVAIGLPKASDGVGSALRSVYRPAAEFPLPWTELLGRIDRVARLDRPAD